MRPNTEKAARLFQYLSEVQKMKEKKVLTLSDFSRDGKYFWLSELTSFAKEGGSSLRLGPSLAGVLGVEESAVEQGDDSVVLALPRPEVVDFPQPSTGLKERLSNDGANSQRRPELDAQTASDDEDQQKSAELLQKEYKNWLSRWDEWADNERFKKLYQEMFEVQTKANQQADEYELILGLGSLYWALPDGDTIKRPIFSAKLSIEMDKHSGKLTLSCDDGIVSAEMDIIPAEHLSDSRFIADVKSELENLEGDVLLPSTFNELGKLTANSLSTDAVYAESLIPPAESGRPTLAWAPVIILRRRQRTGLAMSFASIAEKILETGRIPDGMAALIDPNQQASVEEPAGLGAIYENDDDIFSPLPLNTRQKAVLERVDSHSQTIVQGPPGTGKTHMAAALLSHLLAQGKRVLVTAETDRALYELRGKMPKEIQELAVSVIGSSESDIADLRVAVDTISRKSSEFDSKLSDKEIGELNDRLNVLGERRVRAVRRWADRMESESSPIEVEGYGETVSRAIEKWLGQKDEYDWIQVVALADLENPFPLTDGEISEWLRLLETPELKQYRHLQSADTFDLNSIPTVESFQAMCSDWKSVNAEHQALANKVPGKQLDRWESCSQDDRAKLVTAGRRVVEICEELEKDTRPWSKDFSPAMTSFEVSNAWRDLEGLRVKISEVRKTSEPLQGIRKIVVNGDAESFVPIARSLQEFLTKGGKISAKPDGTVKLGFFPKRVVRDSMPFFESVRIDGMPPTTLEQVTQFLAYVDFNWIMEDLHGSWSYFDERGSVDPQLQVNNDADRLEECSSRLHKIAELSQQSEFGN